MNTKLIPILNGEVPTPSLFTLSTDHAASSYGIPVLVDEGGNAYSPEDVMPSGESAKALVERIERGQGALFDFTDGRARQNAEGIRFQGDTDHDPLDLDHAHPFVTLFITQQ